MGGSRWAWNSASTVALIVLFGITAMIFAVSQHFRFFTTRQNRVFPAHFLKDWNLAGLFVSTACGIGSIFIAIYYVPLYFLFVHGESGTQAAIRMLPYVCTYITGVVACGLLLKRTGYPIIWYMASSIVLVIGSALWSTVNESTPMAATYGYSILVGFGMTTTQAGYSLGPQLAKNAADASNILRFLNIAQQSAQMMALVVASAIFQNLTFNNLKTILQGTGYSDSDIQAAMAGAKSQILQNVSPDLRDQCIRAIVSTIQKEWYIVIACSAVMLVQSAFFRRTRFYS
jgi:predicted MFS family arabinose efflux permease